METFPQILGQPSQQNYNFSNQDSILRTKMDGGNTRQRKRFDHHNSFVAIEWRFTQSQFLVFELFFSNSVNQGADWFMMKVKTPFDNDFDEVRFTGPYSASLLFTSSTKTLWSVKARLEIRELRKFGHEVYGNLLRDGWTINGMLSLMNRVNYIVNTEMPTIYTDQP